MHDVIIVGGGPSGLFAANQLAHQGLAVLILEKKSQIGENIICTGIVSQRTFREFDLSRESVLRDIQKVTLISPGGDSWEYQHPFPFASVVDRESFDRFLRDQALLSGVEIKTDHDVVDVSIDPHSADVLAQTSEGHKSRMAAKTVIIATGINYRLHKKLGLGYPKHFVNGVQAELEMEGDEGTKIFIGKSLAPGAFAWLVPIGRGRARIGLMTEKNPEGYFRRLLDRINPERALSLENACIQTKVIAQGLLSRTFGDRVLAIGEAAGQIKTTTGGGVYFGLLCAGIAAGVLARNFRDGRLSAPYMAEYERLWKKAVQREIQVGLSLRRLWAGLNDSFIEKVFKLAKHDGFIPLIRERGDFDWHGDLLLALLKRIPCFQSLFGWTGPCSVPRMN